MSKFNNKLYPGCAEVVPGVFLDPDGVVYIVDKKGEVVSHVNMQPEDFIQALQDVIIATRFGPKFVRKNIEGQGNILRGLISVTQGDEAERCDECGKKVPYGIMEMEGAWHQKSCPLHTDNIT